MKSNYLGKIGLWLGMVTMLFGSAVLVQAANTSRSGVNEAHVAARLIRDLKADAIQVRSAAMLLDTLTKNPSATWLDYDRQWNEIKPSVEDMQMKLVRLEGMQSAISAAERQEIDQSKVLIEEIQGRTHQLRTLLDEPGVRTTDPKFKAYARSLSREASQLERTTAVS